VLKLEGTAADDAEDDRFELTLDRGQAFTDPSLDVALGEGTLILVGCDQEAQASVIQGGTRVIVFGKYSSSESLLRAVAVIVKAREIQGDLEALVPTNGGYLMTIRTSPTTVQEVVLPAGEPIYLEGDGSVGFELLQDLLGCFTKIPVRVSLDDSIAVPPTAEKARVVPSEISGMVTTVNSTIVLDSGESVTIQPGATVLKDQKPVEIASIQVGDRITAFGLKACEKDPATDFFGFVILVETD
jgi:hypothetical protein